MQSAIRQLEREAAQTMVEYTVVLGVITLAIVTTYALLSGAMQSMFDAVSRVLS